MYGISDYVVRGGIFLNNQIRPSSKQLASLMIYATDLCDSACKHCLIWAKRPAKVLPMGLIIQAMKSKCISRFTKVGLEGGEFLLHPEANGILKWFKTNHPNFDLLSNCLKPDKLINAVNSNTPQRLWISLDGTQETYQQMRGKDGYHKVLEVVQALKGKLPISLMFTLSPYNDFGDLEHVIEVASKSSIDLRVGIYNNIDFFETMEDAHVTPFGSMKGGTSQTFSDLKEMRKHKSQLVGDPGVFQSSFDEWKANIPESIKKFSENYDFILLYQLWQQQQLRIRCFSIFDNAIILPNGDVPLCQNLPNMLGNIYQKNLDSIVNSSDAIGTQKFHSKHCNRCWINYHRKQDVVLYRNLERVFGRLAVGKVLGYYQWNGQQQLYRQIV